MPILILVGVKMLAINYMKREVKKLEFFRFIPSMEYKG